MAIGNLKDGNILQAMARLQAKTVDTWSYYQAKSTKQTIAQSQVEQLMLRLDTEANLSDHARQAITKETDRYRSEVQRYDTEKAAIKAEAEAYQQEHEVLTSHHDQFDMCEAGLTLALALYAVTLLTRKRWLFGLALAFSVFGVVMGIAGFAGWNLHPEWLAQLLG
jgi:chromosome segregation ATPase